jgi:hypothetical protein
MDTTFSISDFADIYYYLGMLNIPEGTTLEMGEQSCPFYIGDYSSSQEIEWIEPHFIIETNSFPAGTTMSINVYSKNDFGTRIYFWLKEDYPVQLNSTPVRVPDASTKLTNIDQFRDVRQIYFDVAITYPENITVDKIMSHKVNLKFSIKFAMKTNLKTNL